MILLFDSSAMTVKTTLVDGDARYDYEWEAGRSLAKELLQYLHERLAEHGWAFESIAGIGVFRGPGSYTGLRIGLTVCNTLAEALQVSIVGATGADWQQQCITQLQNGVNDGVVMPMYGGEAHVTTPKK